MSLFDALAGRSQLLRFEILLADDALCARVLPLRPDSFGEECIRLWAAYQALIIYGFGGADTDRGAAMVQILDDLVREPIRPHTDALARTWLGRSYHYNESLVGPKWQITGTFFARRGTQRRISASVPLCGELQKQASAVGLFQVAVKANYGRTLELLARTAQCLVDIYRSPAMRGALGNTVAATMEIPDKAYELAAGRL